MDQLAQSQKENGGNIERVAANYTKTSSARKTASYLRTKLRELEELWANFETTDNQIRDNHSDKLDHPYFTKGYYQQIQTGYERVVEDINRRLESMEIQDEATNQPQVAEPEGIVDKPNPSVKGTIPKLKYDDTIEERDISVRSLIRKISILITIMRRILRTTIDPSNVQSEQYCKLQIKRIQNHWDEIQSLHADIWVQLNEAALDSYNINEYIEIEEEVQTILIRLEEQLRTFTESSRASSNKNQAAVKLPKVQLPKFDGDYLKWRQFRDLFTELVHNQDIADCHKMWYLKTSLLGDAEKLIRHFTTSDANYIAAWKVINDRYENTRLLVTAFINKLLSQPNHTTESAAAIKGMHDTTRECLLGLQGLAVDISHWDPLLLHILLRKMDRSTHTLWEQSLTDPRALPSITEYLKFMETRFQSLEALGTKGRSLEDKHRQQNPARVMSSLLTAGPECPMCKGHHAMFACNKFLQLSPSERLKIVRTSQLCINCLKSGHTYRKCLSRGCTECKQRHNTLLHLGNVSRSHNSEVKPIKNPPQQSVQTTATQLASATAVEATRGYVLLSSALLRVSNDRGKSVECRAILDSGSQLSFITERLAKQLDLKGKATPTSIEGIGQQRQRTSRQSTVRLHSRINEFNSLLEVHILPKIISAQPSRLINISNWPIPRNIALADPQFNQPNEIDLLIGAELYYSLLAVGQIRLGDTLPTLQNTVFGWTVAGKTRDIPNESPTCGICSEDERLSEQVEKFWKIEDVQNADTALTPLDRQCEDQFHETHRRDSTGRFIVKLPFKKDPTTLGDSKDVAYQRFLAMERKLTKNEQLREQYCAFMREYAELGHMNEVNLKLVNQPYFFLPHHAVIKPESSTTKLRVVFDASAKTTTGASLNDILHIGPTIQEDVFTILLRFRRYRYVFTGDIEKMYRQIKVDQEHQKYQLIWWRERPCDRVRCFQLTTVTYGTACAPYLAVRCLQRLAEEEADKYPLALEVVKENFYVDDVLTGSDSLVEALEKKSQLQSLLQQGGFKLRKWCANHGQLLQGIPPENRELQLDFNSVTDEHIKTMGLIWFPKTDMFRIKYSNNSQQKVTKRSVVSDIAHLFDPLGIVAPVVVVAKLFSQRLWELRVDWDAALPQEHHSFWNHFKEDLAMLNDINVPRHVFAGRCPKTVQVHIFTDASEKAYGAAAYIRSVNKDTTITVRLLCAKSRVAPLKQQTLPRLELCAAKLGAELGDRIKTDLNLRKEALFFWTDSEIVLAWVNTTSSKLQTFVANRVADIQRRTRPEQWRHISTKQNPADVLSRGTSPQKLLSNNLWFYGPMLIHGSEAKWPSPYERSEIECIHELKKGVLTSALNVTKAHFIESIAHRNSFKTLQRIVTYVLRFISRLKGAKPRSLQITAEELERSRIVILKAIQSTEFKDDILHIKQYSEASRSSSISNLAPFIDHEGVLRVGGRLEAAELPYDAKHPILLPYNHRITKIVMNEIHSENKHVGSQALLAITRQQYWPIKGKIMARSIIQHCVHCARAKPKLLQQLMGNLPPARIQPARPFVNSGVDFCGPVWTHFKVRGKRPQKAYIAVFCCFSTKAVHLEIVSDMTTEGFIGALKRFTARRGHCRNIYCDNGSNFIGARNQLQELNEVIQSEGSIRKIATVCSTKGTDFHLIPPRAPHFGGLWEAAVKSAKHLLQSTIAAAALTYEEMETVITEVEAILNSRPLTPMSSDPNDLMAITPGHLLIGEPLTTNIDVQAQPLNVTLLTRWKLVTHLKNEFWRRWQKEYLNQLQYRYKWKQRADNIKPGNMVIMKEDNTPPLRWALGRIIRTYPGEDGLVRVADVRTSTGVFRRPIHKLAPLPVDESKTVELTEPSGSETQSELVDMPASSVTEASQGNNSTESNEHQPNNHHKEEIPARKRIKPSLGSAIVTLLITCLVLPSNKASPVEITPFTNQPGIYFENLGPSNIISSEWNLIAYYSMETFWKEFQSLEYLSKKLMDICKQLHESNLCLQTTRQVQSLISELAKNNEMLINQPQKNRKRRGAINFVGNMANALFGVLDSEYAKEMSATIGKIEKNEIHLSELIKNQTSLIDATVNVIRSDQEALTKKFRELDNHINKLSEGVATIQQELQQEQLSQLFTSVALQTTLLTSNFLRIQDTILDVLVDTHHGRISPLLITPAQLRDEINKIKTHLPSSLQLPAIPNNMLNIYSLISIKGKAEPNHIIFKISLPLLASENFELFHIISVPVKANNTFVAIQPSFPYILLNLYRDKYYPMTEQDLSSCISFNKERYLCKQGHPMYRKGSRVSACEIHFLNQDQQSPLCHITKVENGPHWIQLRTSNQWIYSLNERTTLNVVCGANTTRFNLEQAGLLKVEPNCVIKHQLLTIQGHSLYPSITRLSYTPPQNLTENLTVTELQPILRQTHNYMPHLEELAEIKRRLMEVNSELPARIDHHDIHQYTVAYVSFLLIIISIMMYATLKCRTKFTSTKGTCFDSRTSVEPQDAAAAIDDDFTANFDPQDG